MDMILSDDERFDIVNDNLAIIQKKDGLTFGTDALFLAAYIRRQPSAKALELGGGSGIISLLLATRGKLGNIECAEIQSAFAEIIKKNITANRLDKKIKCICTDIRALKEVYTPHSFDVVFSNPPYMKANSGKTNDSGEKAIARHEIHGEISDFVRAASDMLKFGGLFYCVYKPERLSELFSALEENKLEPKRLTFVHAKAELKPSMILLEAKSGAAKGLTVTPPLIIQNSDGSNTEIANKIYETGDYN